MALDYAEVTGREDLGILEISLQLRRRFVLMKRLRPMMVSWHRSARERVHLGQRESLEGEGG